MPILLNNVVIPVGIFLPLRCDKIRSIAYNLCLRAIELDRRFIHLKLKSILAHGINHPLMELKTTAIAKLNTQSSALIKSKLYEEYSRNI